MLAPGIMISACGLLLLGIHNKYSIVVNRIRVLEEEKRSLIPGFVEKTLNIYQSKRLESIQSQIVRFEYRVKLIRNVVFFYTLSVALFVLSSLSIGLSYIIESRWAESFSMAFFLAGMISVLIGIIFAAREVWKGYEIVQIEVQESRIPE
ncbi:MAG: DUF2721 domain-containing protein [Bacteroidales bacterium]|nr:DUF2721 domain-containing protein [Bacteroidales bacterium]